MYDTSRNYPTKPAQRCRFTLQSVGNSSPISNYSNTEELLEQRELEIAVPAAATHRAPAHAHAAAEPSRRQVVAVFAGLMLGMFVSSLNLTLVAPAMPTIVAQLGGLDHYSWIALSSLLASTIVVPVAGKLSDLYGRRPFYMAGIGLFM